MLIAIALLVAGSAFVAGGYNPMYETGAARVGKKVAGRALLSGLGLFVFAVILRVSHVSPGLHRPWWVLVGVVILVVYGIGLPAAFIGRQLFW